jgi:hypothetical protein
MEQIGLSVEASKETVIGHCDTCGHETRVFRGYIRQHGSAFGVYLARYTDSHPEYGASLAISLRGWGEGNDPGLKECIALEWRVTETGPECVVVDATTSPWGGEAFLGRMLSGEEALNSGRAQEAFLVSDAIWLADARLPLALGQS